MDVNRGRQFRQAVFASESKLQFLSFFLCTRARCVVFKSVCLKPVSDVGILKLAAYPKPWLLDWVVTDFV